MLRDFQISCPRHGCLALVVSTTAPERALCWVCNDDAKVVDSGKHDCHNYPDEGGCHGGTEYNHE